MNKAMQIFEILSENHTKPIPKKYAKAIIQIATLEEKISTLMSFGMVEKSQSISAALIDLISAIKQEYIDDQKR